MPTWSKVRLMSPSATTSGRGLGPPGGRPLWVGATTLGSARSRYLTKQVLNGPCCLAGIWGHDRQSGLLDTGPGGYPERGERDRDRLSRVTRRLPPRRMLWRFLSSSSLSSSCLRSPLDHCWPCATLRRLTSSPQEPTQLTSRARSRTPARAPPRRPHPGTPKTNRRRLGDPGNPPRLRLAWGVTTLRTGRAAIDRSVAVPLVWAVRNV